MFDFIDDKGLKLSTSLAYYTIFALAPLLLLVMSLVGIFYGKDAVEGRIFVELNGLIGATAALQIQEMIKSIQLSNQSTMAFTVGLITLLIGATSIFVEIQDSINMIWRVKAKPKKGWLKIIIDRLLSSSMIISLGFLLVVSLLVNSALLALMDRLSHVLPKFTVLVANALKTIISFVVITILFGTIFKVLPDAKIKWRDVRMGAFLQPVYFCLAGF